MTSRLWIIVAVIAGAAGMAIGFVAGARHGGSEQLSDSYVGTAGHTKTYVSIARYLRKGDTSEALTLADAMINAGVTLLKEPPSRLDDQAKTYISESLAVVREYQRETPMQGAR
jgi:hypothetical protein